jgi:hypothetical protein
MLIGFTGRKGAGKDTAAAVLVSRGFELLKFAGPLKAMLRTLLEVQGADAETIERMIEGDLKEVPSSYLGGRSPRHAMQTLGTQWGREQINGEFWVQAAVAAARQHDHVVFADIRFPNEAAAIREAGGRVFRITRPSMVDDDAHVSERLIDELEVDGELLNDFSNVAAFQAHVAELIA